MPPECAALPGSAIGQRSDDIRGERMSAGAERGLTENAIDSSPSVQARRAE
jgi:hypothetical protein